MGAIVSYGLLDRRIWILTNIGRDRDARLFAVKYPEIVRAIAETASISHDLESSNDGSSQRAVIHLTLGTETVDLFHNGAGGYRAQFLISPSVGEQANRFLVSALSERIYSTACSRDPDSASFIKASLDDERSKAWISEDGDWFFGRCQPSAAHRALMVLQVARWEQAATDQEAAKEFPDHAYRWHRLAPHNETVIEIKGGWLDQNHEAVTTGKSNERRTLQISKYGYT